MNNMVLYDELVRRAGIKRKPQRTAKIITYTVATAGMLAAIIGIILICVNPTLFRIPGGVAAIIGILVLAICPPLYRFVFGKLIKHHIDALIKVLESSL